MHAGRHSSALKHRHLHANWVFLKKNRINTASSVQYGVRQAASVTAMPGLWIIPHSNRPIFCGQMHVVKGKQTGSRLASMTHKFTKWSINEWINHAENTNNSLEGDGVRQAQEAGRIKERMTRKVQAWERERDNGAYQERRNPPTISPTVSRVWLSPVVYLGGGWREGDRRQKHRE